jgi:hypothetical protein
MVRIINSSPAEFEKIIENKTLVLFGAGQVCSWIYKIFHLENRVKTIVDNSPSKRRSSFSCGQEKIPIVGMDDFVRCVKKNGIDDTVMLITPHNFAIDIVEQLDEIPELDNLECYISMLLENYYEEQDFSFSAGERRIPKKIHYCWFGGKEIPEYLQAYINGWKELCPDYEIIRWDESNYDVSKNTYMRESYEAGKWAFVSDYARLDIVWQEGGIYLDTDVELLASPDKLLRDRMFCGFGGVGQVATGLGFGAEKGNEIIREWMDVYNDKTFYNSDGSLNLTICYMYQTSILEKHGFQIDCNTYQKKDGIVIYPSEVLNPLGLSKGARNFTRNTISVHHETLSWMKSKDKQERERYGEEMIHRLEIQS